MSFAALNADRSEVLLKTGKWSDRFPVERLPGWIAFYREMAERKGGTYAKHYTRTLRALERVQNRLEGDART